MTKYLLVDSLNTFFRARYIGSKKMGLWDKIGLSIHINLSIVNKSWHKEGADHVVFFTEGRSWRKDVYAPYKKNRETTGVTTEQEDEETREFFNAYNDMIRFLDQETNVSVLHNPKVEADDLIARWIHLHPNDEHVIISTDSDFKQLLAKNVHLYNGLDNRLYTLDGVFTDNGNHVKDKHGVALPPIDPKWELFEKCMRGDTSDNIFSAYPGVRAKGTRNKVGLTEAFNDMHSKGYAWNNLMLQRWIDHGGGEHKVIDDYNRNVMLVDLKAQPQDIKDSLDETIALATMQAKDRPHVGRFFLRFCGKYDLKQTAQFSTAYTGWLNAGYPT
jgi:5'-3' exonuclease